MPAPHEIIASPFTIYLAAVGTTPPNIDATPSASWTKLGTSGALNYGDDGVTVTHAEKIEFFRGAGSAAPRKAFREEEDFTVEFALADLGPDQYAKIINGAAVTTVAASSGVAGQKYFSLQQGLQVTTFALLARGMSTVDNALNAQYELDAACQSGEPSPVHTKGKAAELSCAFTALDASGDGDFGRLRIQTAVAA